MTDTSGIPANLDFFVQAAALTQPIPPPNQNSGLFTSNAICSHVNAF